MTRYLGLDLGTASLGWCLVEWNRDNRTGLIVDAGVRIFPESLEGTNESNKKPKNVNRRDKRLRRRQTARGSLRRQKMRELLHGMGLAPSSDPDVFNRSDEGRKPTDIYILRKKAVSEKLDECSLGRVFMHLLNHRGFIGSPKEDAELEAGEQQDLTDEQKEKLKESKKRNDDIKLFNDEIGDRTLGAVLAEKDVQRGHPISNKMVLVEFDKIWAEQKKHHSDILTDEMREELKRQLKFRRPIFWRLKSLGKCEHVPGSPLLMKSDWRAQQYIMLQTLNNIRLEDGNKRRLDAEEWAIIRDLMMSKREVTFDQMRKALVDKWQKTVRTRTQNSIMRSARMRKNI